MNLKSVDLSHIVAMSDLHLGMRNNSKQHNEWCVQFIEWMIQQAQAQQVKTCVFLGDWSHNRNSVNVLTLNYSLQALRMLSEGFDNVIMLLGNHDLYFRDNLDIHSIPYANQFHNIHLISEPTACGDCMFVPWMVGDQWQDIRNYPQPYLFCHAEIAKFKMNAMVELPDHGGLNSDHFVHQQLVFSGHFHKRQRKGNILYIGNAFPHNFADAHDDQRGIMFWKPKHDPIFMSWPRAPKFRTLTLSQILSDPTLYIDDRTYAKISVDMDISYEDGQFLRDLFETQLQALDVQLINDKTTDTYSDPHDDDIDFESVDTIVLSHLNSIESTTMDKQLLATIYQSI
jgi:DNA repair exonuclease SbcCD nuclease subunit